MVAVTNNAVNTSLSGQTGTGNFVGATSPTLITPAIGVATATSINFGGQALSTYNTNTFTPILNFGGAATGITYTTQLGTYTTIGNLTFFNINIVLTSKGSATGTATITGLPVTSSGTITSVDRIVVQNLTFLTTNNVVGLINPSSTVISLVNQVNNNVYTNYTITQFSNTTTLIINGFYY